MNLKTCLAAVLLQLIGPIAIASPCNIGMSGFEDLNLGGNHWGHGVSYEFGGSLGGEINPKQCNQLVSELQRVIKFAYANETDVRVHQNGNDPKLVDKEGFPKSDIVFGNEGDVHCEVKISIFGLIDIGTYKGSGQDYQLSGVFPPRLRSEQCRSMAGNLVAAVKKYLPYKYGKEFDVRAHTVILEPSYVQPVETDAYEAAP